MDSEQSRLNATQRMILDEVLETKMAAILEAKFAYTVGPLDLISNRFDEVKKKTIRLEENSKALERGSQL